MIKFIRKYREKIYHTLSARKVNSIGENCKVNSFSKFTNKTIIGNNCHFNGMEILGNGEVSIGDNFHSGKECMIITSFHNYDKGKKIPYDDTNIDKKVIIGENVWIGHRVIILGGVEIGEGAILQAGSVVVNDIPKYGIAGGSPAKVFKNRDIEHYEKLKQEGSYLK